MTSTLRRSRSQRDPGGENATSTDPFIQEVQDAISALLKRGSDPNNENALDSKEMNATIANGIKFLQVKYRIIGTGEEGDFWDER